MAINFDSVNAYLKDIDWKQLQDRRVQLAIVTGIATVYYLYKKATQKRYRLPPGPTPLPLVGNLLATGLSKLHQKYAEYAKKYGPVCTVYLGPKTVVVLNSIDTMKEAFVTKGVDFAGRPKSATLDIFTDDGKDIVGGQYGPVWKLQRKIAFSALRKYTSGNKIEALLKKSFEIITCKLEQQTMPLDVAEWNMLYIYNVFSTLCFGRIFELDDPFFVKLKTGFANLSQYSTSIMLADMFPIMNSRFYENHGIKYMKKLSKDVFEMFDDEYEEHLKTYDPAELSDFMHDLIHLWNQAKNDDNVSSTYQQMTKMHFIQIISDIFFAGTDTTRFTLTAVMLYAAKYPEVQKRIHQEIDDIIGKESEITVRAKDELHYLHAVLYEVMRINPIIPIGVPHETMCDTTIGEYDIAKGTMVIGNVWAVHHDENYCPDHDVFNPDRWLNEDGVFDFQAFPFVPFSMGTRVCVGESLAKVELMITLAYFFQRYNFEAPEGVELPLEFNEIPGAMEPKPFKLNIAVRE